jgi:ribosomal protein S18 acetylase RimI-like enzyme
MQKIIYKAAGTQDFKQLSEWLVRLSQKPEQHCLHTWADQSAEGLAEQLLIYWHDQELCYLMAFRDAEIVGAIGGEYDRSLRRAWLHGPHALLDDWNAMAGELYRRLLAELPQETRQLDAYLNIENVRGRNFYREQGFTERDNLNYDFWLEPDQRVTSGEGGSRLLGKAQEASFIELFNVLFPKTYYSAERIIEMIGQSHQVLVEALGETVLGFAVVSIEGDRSEGELQFFGVREDIRRRGYGKKLLLSAVDWLVDQAGVKRVSLNVGEELVHARALYESVGFRLRFAGIGLEKKLGDLELFWI